MNLTLNEIKDDILQAVRLALDEDIRSGDITAELIPVDKVDTATIITREDCIFCGQAWLEETYKQLGGIERIEWHVKDGDKLAADQKIVTLHGNSRKLLTGERTALNFIQLLSGTATTARHYQEKAGGTDIRLLDTRKTIPGLRTAQKYAVATGGCQNHRIGLYDAFLIKENHISACGSIREAISKARHIQPDKTVEVEVENITELQQALEAGADIIMLDNFDKKMLSEASRLTKGDSKYEVSGNLTIEDIASIKDYNVDYISFGALTKHVQAIDLSFRII